MNSKLTLTVDESVITKAKQYAKKQQRSLSDIIENYLKLITQDESHFENEMLTPIAKALKGSVKIPENFNFNYREELDKRLVEKYLK